MYDVQDRPQPRDSASVRTCFSSSHGLNDPELSRWLDALRESRVPVVWDGQMVVSTIRIDAKGIEHFRADITSVRIELNCTVASEDAIYGSPYRPAVRIAAPPVSLVQEDIVRSLLQAAEHRHDIRGYRERLSPVSMCC